MDNQTPRRRRRNYSETYEVEPEHAPIEVKKEDDSKFEKSEAKSNTILVMALLGVIPWIVQLVYNALFGFPHFPIMLYWLIIRLAFYIFVGICEVYQRKSLSVAKYLICLLIFPLIFLYGFYLLFSNAIVLPIVDLLFMGVLSILYGKLYQYVSLKATISICVVFSVLNMLLQSLLSIYNYTDLLVLDLLCVYLILLFLLIAYSKKEIDKMKSKSTAIILSILLGNSGIDRFYLGYTGLGIVKLLTVGGFGIWWIIDLVMICVGSLKPANGSDYKETYENEQKERQRYIEPQSSSNSKRMDLRELYSLYEDGIISEEEYHYKKREILERS